MKNITVSKNSSLYRLFDWLQNSGYYSFIYNDCGSINSFNDVCTFIQHCAKILLWSIFYIIVSLCLITVVGFMVFVIFGTMFISIADIVKGEYSMFATASFMFPLFFYGIYRYNLYKEKSDQHNGCNETMYSKFVEIVSSRSSKYCVKIDVVDESKDTDVE